MSTLKQPYNFADATFLPFQLGRYFWILMVWGTGVIIALSLLLIPLWLSDFKAFGTLFMTLDASSNPDDAFAFFGLMFKMFLKALPVILLLWAAMASLVTAFHRHAIFGEVRRGFPLRFGRTELQVMLTQFLIFLISLVLVLIVIAIISAIIVPMSIASGGSEAALGGAIGIIFLLMIPFIVLSVYISIRLSPAVAATVRYDRVALKEGWRATRGYFWWMFLSFIVIGIIGGIINQIVQMIMQFGLMGIFATSMDSTALESGDFSSLMDLMTSPGFIIVGLIFIFLIQFISLVTSFFSQGVAAYIVRDDVSDPDSIADVYS